MIHGTATRFIVALSALFLLVVVTPALSAPVSNPQNRLHELEAHLRAVTQEELATGQRINTHRGVYLTGESAAKVERLHREAAKVFEATLARPERERQAAVKSLRTWTQHPEITATYQSTAKSTYNNNVLIEYYTVGMDSFEIDIATNRVIQFGPTPLPPGVKPKEYNTIPQYTPQQLEEMARTFITERANVNLASLTPNHGQKDDGHFFFRWEDRTKAKNKVYPFVQVGFTQGGDLLSYTDVLDILDESISLSAFGGPVTYANGILPPVPVRPRLRQ